MMNADDIVAAIEDIEGDLIGYDTDLILERLETWAVEMGLRDRPTVYKIPFHTQQEIDSKLSFVELLFHLNTLYTFTDGDTTPSVEGGRKFKTSNSSPTTITGFDDGTEGQDIKIIIGDSNTTIQDLSNGSNIRLESGGDNVDFTGLAYDVIDFIYDGTDWVESNRNLK